MAGIESGRESMTERISLNGPDWLFKNYIGEDWLWRNAHKPGTRDILGWLPGTVPGSVQHDLWQAGAIPDPYFERNSLLIEWVPARTWLYQKRFVVANEHRGKRAQLRFAGVDYSARFFLNGELLGEHCGMFTPAAFEIGDLLQYEAENLLCVVIDPAPVEQPQVGYSSRVRTHKTRMNYWWDFCPRMVHLGIWDDVTLELTGPVRVEDVFVQPHLADDLGSAAISVSAELSALESVQVDIETRVLQHGRCLAGERSHHALAAGRTHINVCLPVTAPELWWPNGYGAQPLYEVSVTVFLSKDLIVVHRPEAHPDRELTELFGGSERKLQPADEDQISDGRQVSFGIRKIELTANETPDATALPYTFIVNGRKIYAKGWNWVPIDVLYGVRRPHKLARLLELARQANVNLLRVWGGGLIESEAFYSLCDSYGIMVWQEFIQSSSGIENVPPGDPEFLARIVDEAGEIVPGRRNHASLVIWCGGNELMETSGKPLDDERAPVLGALHAVVRRLDPDRHWLPTSPSGRIATNTLENIAQDPLGLHDVHGPWEYQGLTEQYTLYNQATSLFHSEFGVEGLANLATLERCLAPENRWPVTLANPAWSHTSSWWLREAALDAAFGALPDLASTVAASQFLQAEGLRYAVEADRRRKYHNSGTLPWQFNEPYPNAACTSAVDYFARPKPVYYAVARAYTPILVSARFARQALPGLDTFEAEVWASNSRESTVPGAMVIARLVGAGGAIYEHHREEVTLAANSAVRLATIAWPLAGLDEELFFLDLALSDTGGTPLSANRYLFSRCSDLVPMLTLPPAALQATMAYEGNIWRVLLTNTGSEVALNVCLEDARSLDQASFVYFDDNYFCVLPGEVRAIQAKWDNVPPAERGITVRAWNSQPLHLREEMPV